MSSDPDANECPICQLQMVLPTTVPGCGHKFCFVCIKGASMLSPIPLCPMCRGRVDMNMFSNPKRHFSLDMKEPDSPKVKAIKADPDAASVDSKAGVKNDASSYWLYQGRHCWWRFDPRCERDIEAAMTAGLPLAEVCVCGATYIIDFNQMIQYKKSQGFKQKRNIKRVDQAAFEAMKDEIKGMAGVAVSQ